jgi:hypothetical protein
MATEESFIATNHGVGSRPRYGQTVALTMTAGATATGQMALPQGSWITTIRGETPAAFSGSPTNINLRVGNAAAGQQLLADTDVKAQGEIMGSIAAAYDRIANNDTTLFFQLAANGGTSPAGTCNVLVEYFPPVR